MNSPVPRVRFEQHVNHFDGVEDQPSRVLVAVIAESIDVYAAAHRSCTKILSAHVVPSYLRM